MTNKRRDIHSQIEHCKRILIDAENAAEYARNELQRLEIMLNEPEKSECEKHQTNKAKQKENPTHRPRPLANSTLPSQ